MIQDHNEFILPGSICALAADQKSPDTVWFLKIDEQIVPTTGLTMTMVIKLFKVRCVSKVLRNNT